MSVGQSQYWVKIISGTEFQRDFLFLFFSILAITDTSQKIDLVKW